MFKGKALFLLIACAVLTLGSVLCDTAKAAPVLKNGNYVIQMAGTRYCLAPSGKTAGSPVRLGFHEDAWYIEGVANTLYKISMYGLYMQPQGGSSKKATPVIIGPKPSRNYGLWTITKVGPFYSIINVDTHQSLDLHGNKRAPGGVIETFKYHGEENQIFTIRPVKR